MLKVIITYKQEKTNMGLGVITPEVLECESIQHLPNGLVMFVIDESHAQYYAVDTIKKISAEMIG